MSASEVSERFIASLERSARFLVPNDELGHVLSCFPVVGGGTRCIVIIADGMVVRLSEHAGLWIGEHLVLSGE